MAAISFDPTRPVPNPPSRDAVHIGESRDRSVYVFDDNIVLTVKIALATARPLLVYGPPGSGKSSLAPNIARIMGWRYYEFVVSSSSEAQELLWKFDAVRRLADAQVGRLSDHDDVYLEPGVLWSTFDPRSAGMIGRQADRTPAVDSDPFVRAVVLIDEIDKAQPDLPDNLLVPLGARRFRVGNRLIEVAEPDAPLIVITTNDERDLSRPFVRRCIILNLPAPTFDQLTAVARAHFGEAARRRELYGELASLVVALRKEADDQGLPIPSTAEYLDTITACLDLGVGPESPDWKVLTDATLRKRPDPSGTVR